MRACLQVWVSAVAPGAAQVPRVPRGTGAGNFVPSLPIIGLVHFQGSHPCRFCRLLCKHRVI